MILTVEKIESLLSHFTLTLKEKRKYKSEKEFESDEKRKSAITFVTALFFLVAGTGISRRASQPEWT